MSVKDTKRHWRLAEYTAKRREGLTPEPFPGGARRPGQFVIHQHAARRMHFDLRLEVDGVLRSWAVPQGPSLDPQDKRLAVQTEDHPVEYIDFEDIIPEGNYGAGPMIVWDRGRWVERFDDQTGEDKLLFDLYGYKLRGRFTLVRTRRDPKEWLLIKKADAFARSGEAAELSPLSVYSGLTVQQLGAGESPAAGIVAEAAAAGAVAGKVNAASVDLMLARTSEAPFSRPGWLFEIKYDGYRMVAGLDRGQVHLRYRNGGDATDLYPEIAPAIAALACESAVLDGEVVVLDEAGRPSFSQLARRARLSRDSDILIAAAESPAAYMAFDLLEFDGCDLRPLPLLLRKQLLRRLLPPLGPVRYCDHIEQFGEEMYKHARKLGLEGLMAKRADSRYRGGRSDAWLKVRVDREATLAVVGYTLLEGSRTSLGALLLAARDGERLAFIGRAGSGFSDADRAALRERLEALGRNLPADELSLPPPGGRGASNLPSAAEAHWVKPVLACEVRFKEVTDDGMLRHPVFLRLRDDVPARDCVVQQPGLEHALAILQTEPEPSVPALDPGPSPGVTHITRPEKILWPADGITKGELIDYYREVADWILPYLRNRPLVLDRYPDGIDGKSFFQKHAPHFTPDWVRTVRIHSDSGERDIDYFVVDDVEGLVYMANAAAIPLHVWSSRVDRLQRPDWAILDLDPKEASFDAVITVAQGVRALCEQIGIDCFVKTSGKTGLHVLVPLGAQVEYPQARMFADLLGLIVARRLPELATVNRALHARGGRVYIDAVQNGAGRLLVAPLCVRPFPGAPVSTPLRWEEVRPGLDRGAFTVRTVPARLRRDGDPMLPVLDARPDLMGALQRLSALQSAR